MSSNNKTLLVKATIVPELEAGTFFKKSMDPKSEKLADKMIQQLLEAGYTYNKMIPVFRLARKKYSELLKSKTHGKN